VRTLPLLTLAAAASLLAGCASPSDASADGLTVVAAVYPLQFVAQAVGGEHVNVDTAVPPGVEPHELELSPAAVRALGAADLVLRIDGFQAAVDDAVATTGARSLDVASVVALHAGEHEHDDHDAHGEPADGHGHNHGDLDPHFWLDPRLLADFAFALADELTALDPDHADAFAANAQRLASELTALHESFAAGLASCERRQIVTGHAALGYLAEAYDLEQLGITGLDPESEPSPARMREIVALVEDSGATTVFAEAASASSVVEAVAADTGVAIAVLSPLETVGDGEDYLSVMRRNLDALREGLGCD